jgi:hypothetical protein
MTINHTNRPTKPRASIILSVAAALLAVVIAGCGGSSSGSSSTPGAAAAPRSYGAQGTTSVNKPRPATGPASAKQTEQAHTAGAAVASTGEKPVSPVHHAEQIVAASPRSEKHAPPVAAAEQKPAATATERQATAATTETGGIPQNNGGDQDADNNGGPSDGDGNV